MDWFIFLIILVIASSGLAGGPIYNLRQAKYLFEQFKQDYNRKYRDATDEFVHYLQFVTTLLEINRNNSRKDSTYVADINKFADYTDQELENVFGWRPETSQVHKAFDEKRYKFNPPGIDAVIVNIR